MKSLIISFALFSACSFGQTEPKLAASAVEPVMQEKGAPKSEPVLAPFSIEKTANKEENSNVVPVLAPFSIEPVKKETTSEEKK